MKFPYFIIISGPPATGKTTLGIQLKNHYKIPFIYKDLLKESLFNSLGIIDRDWSRKIGYSSILLLKSLLEVHLDVENSIIIESAFFSQLERIDYMNIINKHKAIPIEIHCYGSQEVIIKRFQERDSGKDRHNGHISKGSEIELEKRLIDNTYGPLSLNENVIELQTDDFSKISFTKLQNDIDNLIGK